MIDLFFMGMGVTLLAVDVLLTFNTNRKVDDFDGWKNFVNQRLDDLLSNAGKTFLNLSERMDKIEEKQK